MPESEIIFSVQEFPEGGYETSGLALPILQQAGTMDEPRRNVRKAGRSHFDEGHAVIRPHTVEHEVIRA
jgi:hypothetical protein